MKYIIIGVVIVALATAIVSAQQDGYPTNVKVNIDGIIANDRLFQNHIACIDGTGKCSPDGQLIKNNMAEAVATCCAKCNARQKDDFGKVYRHLAKTIPDALDRLRALYDPTGAHEIDCRKEYAANKN